MNKFLDKALENKFSTAEELKNTIEYETFCNIYNIRKGVVYDTICGEYGISIYVYPFILWVYENNLIYNDLASIITLWKLEKGKN
jgi:hypothetical protein